MPLHDADGAVLGALCMLDVQPHGADSVPMPELREVAAQAEARLADRLRDGAAPEPVRPTVATASAG